MACRALHELESIADDLEAEAESLERFSAAKRGSNEAEREAALCRVEAGMVRQEAKRFAYPHHCKNPFEGTSPKFPTIGAARRNGQ